MTNQSLRIALIGCGKVADQHVQAIHRIGDCQIIAVCDREHLMAEQLAERFGIEQRFSDAAEMLRSSKPDAVHITTPPQSHFDLAAQCLQAGAHVYLEKPFTITAGEAEELIDLANERGLKITAGHNYQFTLEMLRMRELIKNGILGGKPTHVESYWSYDLGDLSYVMAMAGNRNHWVRLLPGQLLHNIISHGIAKLAEFLDDELLEINASGRQSAAMRKLGAEGVLDELRVMITDKTGATASFLFSTTVKGINQVRVYGPTGSIEADIIAGTTIWKESRSYKSYLTYFIPPLKLGLAYIGNGLRNIANFLGRRLYQDFGMTELVRRFYKAIRTAGEPPIPYREILLTARIMDEIFAKIYPLREPTPNMESRVSQTKEQGTTNLYSSPVTGHLSLSQ